MSPPPVIPGIRWGTPGAPAGGATSGDIGAEGIFIGSSTEMMEVIVSSTTLTRATKLAGTTPPRLTASGVGIGAGAGGGAGAGRGTAWNSRS